MQIECEKSLKLKKKTFLNAADFLDAVGDEKQVFCLEWPKVDKRPTVAYPLQYISSFLRRL